MFPAVLDNTIVKDFQRCPTLAMYRHVKNLRPNEEQAVDLHFGGCFATGVETARKGYWGSEPLSAASAMEAGIADAVAQWGTFQPPAKHNKTLGALVRSLRYYFGQWPLGEDGLVPAPRGIERMFDIAIPLLHPDTGEFLRYAGRYDLLGWDAGNRAFVVLDEKTTSRLGDMWVWNWDMDSQITGYIWSVRQELLRDDLDYGDEFPEITGQVRGISVLKDGNGHAEIPIVRTPWMIDRWYENMLSVVSRMIGAYQCGEWELSSGGCVMYNRRCDYMPLCLSSTPERVIPSAYKRVVWNPLERKK